MKLQNNLSIKNSMFIKHHVSEFNEQQLEVLRKAIKHSVDITQYADPKYDSRQLNIIFLGLLNNIDVSYYADPAFSNFQMETIMYFLESIKVRYKARMSFYLLNRNIARQRCITYENILNYHTRKN